MQHTCKLALAQMRMTDSVEENLQKSWSFVMKRRTVICCSSRRFNFPHFSHNMKNKTQIAGVCGRARQSCGRWRRRPWSRSSIFLPMSIWNRTERPPLVRKRAYLRPERRGFNSDSHSQYKSGATDHVRMGNPCSGHAESGFHRHVQPGGPGGRHGFRRRVPGGISKRRRDHKSRRPGAADTLRTESRRSTGMAGESSISGNQKARVVSVILRISLLHVTIKPLIAWRMKQQI